MDITAKELAEAAACFSKEAEEPNREEQPAFAAPAPAQGTASPVDIAADFMTAYADAFEELAK